MGKSDYDWLMTPPSTPLVTGSDIDPMADMTFASKKGPPNLVRSLGAIKTRQLTNDPSVKPDSAVRSCRGNPGHATNRRSSLAPATGQNSRPGSRPSTPTSRPIISPSNSSGGNRHIPGLATAKSSTSSRSTTPLRRPSTPVSSHRQSQSAGGRSSSAGRVSTLPSRSVSGSRGSSPTTRPRAWQQSIMPEFSLEPPPNLRTSVPIRSLSNSRGASTTSVPKQTVAAIPTFGSSKQSIGSLSSIPSSNYSHSASPSRHARPGTSLLSTGSSRPTSSSSSSTNPALTSRTWASSPSSTASSRTSDPLQDRLGRQSFSPRVARSRTSTAERSLSRNSKRDCSPHDVARQGTKMVDAMVQSRRTPALSVSPDNLTTSQTRRAAKLSNPISKDSTAYGKAMSRKSIDMALRHMDMRGSTAGGMRSLVSSMPASSFYMVRSTRGVRQGHSPLATSSTVSSEHNMSIVKDLDGSEIEDANSEVGSRASPRSVQDCLLSAAKEARVTKWVDSGHFTRESCVEALQMFRKGTEKVDGFDDLASARCLHQLHGGGGLGFVSCELCNLKSRLRSLRASPISAISAAESLNVSSYACSSNGVPSPASSLL